MIRIAVNGAKGRMGSAIINVISSTEDSQLACAYDRPDSSSIGTRLDPNQGIVLAGADTLNAAEFDVLIDFSSPESVIAALELCAAAGKPVVTGVTGFSDTQLEKINSLSTDIPIVYSPNMSIGVNLCFQLIQQIAAAIGHNADIDILEIHHRHKKDAPSGTSLKMGEIIADTLGLDMQSAAMFPYTEAHSPRLDNKIGFQVIRGGDTVGEHTVMFTMDGERIEISHRAFSRLAFARGAVRAALWVHGKSSGMYGMDAVIQSQ